jgi:hypothetical protein
MCRRFPVAGPLALALMLASGVALASARGAFAQNAAAQFAADSHRLEDDVTAAQNAWDEQRRLYQTLLTAAQELEAGLDDPDATSRALRALEDRYSAALEAAFRQARATSDSRRRVYDDMDRLAAAGRRVEQEKKAALEVPIPGGLWRIEVPESDAVGLMRLKANGTLVSGDYRLSNGRHGSVSGTYAGGRLDLIRVDSQSGRDLSLTAEVDAGAETLSGAWQRNELASGGPAMGSWSGVRLGPGDEVPDLDPD